MVGKFSWIQLVSYFIKILKIYLSLYMDQSEVIDDDVNDGRISDVLRCIAMYCVAKLTWINANTVQVVLKEFQC